MQRIERAHLHRRSLPVMFGSASARLSYSGKQSPDKTPARPVETPENPVWKWRVPQGFGSSSRQSLSAPPLPLILAQTLSLTPVSANAAKPYAAGHEDHATSNDG